MAAGEPQKPNVIQRLEQQRDRHRNRSFAVRVVYIVVGFTLLGAGLAMLVLPGPAFVVIPIGLALLSLEFAWAERLLDGALEKGEIARQKAAETTRRQRILAAIAGTFAAGAVIAWALLGDIPLLPF